MITITVAIVGRVITIWEEIQKTSYEPNYKTYIKFKQRGLRVITLQGAINKSPILLSQYWENYHS